jgi:hypothetical protein
MAKEISKVVKLQVREVLRTVATGWTCFRAAVLISWSSVSNARTQDKPAKYARKDKQSLC